MSNLKVICYVRKTRFSNSSRGCVTELCSMRKHDVWLLPVLLWMGSLCPSLCCSCADSIRSIPSWDLDSVWEAADSGADKDRGGQCKEGGMEIMTSVWQRYRLIICPLALWLHHLSHRDEWNSCAGQEEPQTLNNKRFQKAKFRFYN